MQTDAMKRLPYRVHTNLELGLMLRGTKPFAMFAVEYDRTPECLRRYLRMFDRHVESGRFIRREHILAGAGHGFRYIFYALPAEEWRVERMISLKESSGPWTADHEREEGRLLGYEDWMNDIWLDRYRAEARKDA
jgi:hypothetical protein